MKQNLLLLFVALVVFQATPFTGFAKPVWKEVKSLPFTTKPSHRFEKDQSATTRMTIDEDGSILVVTTFENAKKLEGDHLYCRIELFDASTNRIAVARQEGGLNAMVSNKMKPVKRTITSKGKVRADKASGIKYVRLTYGHFDKADDSKFWDEAKKGVRATGKIIGAIKSGDFAILVEDYAQNDKPNGDAAKKQIKEESDKKLPANKENSATKEQK